MENEVEIWKDIDGFSGYQVSNLGRVKSLVKEYRKQEKILKGTPNTTGYMIVQIYKDKNRKSMLVHRLVMLTFQPNEVMEELFVNHKDLNIKNNNISNLEWVTHKENVEHYWNNPNIDKRLPVPFGSEHHLSNLTDDKVIELRAKWELVKGVWGARTKLAREYGISESTARLITTGKTWKHLL